MRDYIRLFLPIGGRIVIEKSAAKYISLCFFLCALLFQTQLGMCCGRLRDWFRLPTEAHSGVDRSNPRGRGVGRHHDRGRLARSA
jgi:hypothetical protein